MDINNVAFTLEDNNRYIVIESVEYEGKKYVYLVNSDNQIDSKFREVNLVDGGTLREIDSELFEYKIFPMFLEKFKEYN